jgi:uncharacterized RDD family membrane protein YckC
VLCFECSLLTGVEASAAQNAPVTKTCLQCGAVLPSSVRVCNFCDSSLEADRASNEKSLAFETQGNLALDSGTDPSPDAAWRKELANRLEAYRSRRKKLATPVGQSQLPFRDSAQAPPKGASVTVSEPPADEEFSFTVAIGRCAPSRTREDARMLIDVSLPPKGESVAPRSSSAGTNDAESGMYPVASLDDRRLAAVIDAACLLFAYGGFLALFGSMGGQFTLSKLSAAVYVATFAIVYLQYFSLFTIFGGTTPGMMLRGLQVVSFSGEPPTPRQMLLRSAGYVLSAGTLFMGFLWSMWDEDELTWHDRLSQTYLSSTKILADLETHGAAQSR